MPLLFYLTMKAMENVVKNFIIPYKTILHRRPVSTYVSSELRAIVNHRDQ
jgi:hypothetical protein